MNNSNNHENNQRMVLSLRACRLATPPPAEDLFIAEREQVLALRQAWKESGLRGGLSAAELEFLDSQSVGNPGRKEIEEAHQKEAQLRDVGGAYRE